MAELSLEDLENFEGYDEVSKFSKPFITSLSEAIASPVRTEEIFSLIKGQIDSSFGHFRDFPGEYLWSSYFPGDLWDRTTFEAEYLSHLHGLHSQVKQLIQFGVLCLPRQQRSEILEELEQELDSNLNSDKEQEKLNALFESLEVPEPIPDLQGSPVTTELVSSSDFPDASNVLDDQSVNEQFNSIPGALRKEEAILGKKRNTDVSSTDRNKHELDRERKETPKSGHIWNHSTISRDETSANDVAKRLRSINSPRSDSESVQRYDCLRPNTARGIPLRRQQVQTTRLAVSNPQLIEAPRLQQLYHQHHSSLINSQKARTQQNNFSNTRKRLIPTFKNPIMDKSKLETNMTQRDQDSEAPTLKGPIESIVHESHAIDHYARGNDLVGSATEFENLKHRIALLEKENEQLKKDRAAAPRFQALHFIGTESSIARSTSSSTLSSASTMAYLDKPTWSPGPNKKFVLRANYPIPDVPGFLRQNPEIAFVVSYYYTPGNQDNEVQNAARAKRVLPQPKASAENISLQSTDMIEAVEAFLALQSNLSQEFPALKTRGPFHAPYLFWYYYRSPTALDVLSQPHRDTMKLLTGWVEEHYAENFDQVDDHLKRGVISEDTMPFLVRPGNVLVWKEQHEIKAVIAKSWSSQKDPTTIVQEKNEEERDWTKDERLTVKRISRWTVKSWKFSYDGKFHHEAVQVDIVLSLDQPQDEIRIRKLNIHPLEYAESLFKTVLENRGALFWRCRHQHLVSYENLPGDEQSKGERFMVDFETYRQLHSSSRIDEERYKRGDSDSMESDKPPPAPDIYVFPNTIPGYNLRSKKWVDLTVDLIQEVTWNKKSFEYLVVDDETKELVQALVKHQIAAQKSTDIIDRKGNGLIILLHGGPGTGKTYTAESVAEMAEKPLFRITCGDIGTEPEKVENYLDSVLYLGKIWDCIVLIDEAEVFLEQRNLNNLERNALVSVFLRVLEYYQGILILTSNRVGTFDEAFKSRILLSLHYENLTEGQRTKIWKNFFKRQKELDDAENKQESSVSASSVTEPGSRKRKFEGSREGIDFDDVECYITELAKHELNGRQIRNVITTARQLAMSRNELMQYKHLIHVIKVSSKFDHYLKTVREGFSDDQVARDEGIR